MLLRNDGAQAGVLVQWVAWFQFLRSLGELLHHLVFHRPLHEQAGPRRAHLALTVEDAVLRAADGALQIGIGEDDVRTLAAEFQRYPLHCFGSVAHDLLADFRRAGKGDLVHSRVLDQRCARRRAATRQHVERTGRESRLEHDLSHRQRREWCLARRLQNHRATGGQGRGEFPRGEVEGEIPGNDRADHPDRLAKRIREERPIHRQRLARDLVRPSAIVTQSFNTHRDVDLRLEQYLAVL